MTRGEARASQIIGGLFLLLMLAAVFDDFTPRKLAILFMVFFWVPMLVLHEAGHALMARLLGWRVREMVIGFGRTLWRFNIGETRIKVKPLPVEGYVLPAPSDSNGVRWKSTLIYAAGPGAELLLLALMIAVIGWDRLFAETDDVFLIAAKSLAVVILLGAGFNLLPFRTNGAMSDGLGILASPFMPAEQVELRLLTFELREANSMLAADNSAGALALLEPMLDRYPDNPYLRRAHAAALSASGATEDARDLVRGVLGQELPLAEQQAWLQLQAQVELDAAEPSYMVLDLALQKALANEPHSAPLLAIKGASLIDRGKLEAGGKLLADAWRRNTDGADDAFLLAYLTIAAHRCREYDSRDHFVTAFRHANTSQKLAHRVARRVKDLMESPL